jgi:hypothetical protein
MAQEIEHLRTLDVNESYSEEIAEAVNALLKINRLVDLGKIKLDT